MEKQTVLMILNPVSGVSDPDNTRKQFEDVFHEAGWNTEIYQTTGEEDLAKEIQNRLTPEISLVVASGGDGTVSEVGSSIAYSGVPMAILPTGTWNALATNLGIPKDVPDALKLMVNEHDVIDLDTIETSGRHYLLNIGVGLSAAVMKSTKRQQKRRFGFLAYIWNLFEQASGLRQRSFRLEVDGTEIKTRATELMVINSSIIGIGETPTVLDIRPNDGKVEILTFQAPTILGLMLIAFNILVGRQRKPRGFTSYTAERKIVIRNWQRMVVQADGEIIGYTPVEIKLNHAAVKLVVPPKNIQTS